VAIWRLDQSNSNVPNSLLLTCALPAKAGFVTFALSGIATALLELQQRTAELAQKDLANIKRRRRLEKHVMGK
jgi:hypothetical protein